MIFISFVFIFFSFRGGFGYLQGIFLLLLLAVYLLDTFHDLNRNQSLIGEVIQHDEKISLLKIYCFLAVGFIGLPLGAELFLENMKLVASFMNLNDSLIGLILIAIGTSLPELATTFFECLKEKNGHDIGKCYWI